MKLVSLLFLSFFSTKLLAQLPGDSNGIKIFDRGLAFYHAGKLEQAVAVFEEIVEKKIAIKYDTYGSAFFNIPTLYWEMKQYDKAKEWYKKILESGLRDSDETGSLMEPHTNYKHKSAVALAGLYQIDSNFTETLNWLYKADTVYRYWGFEGSATNISQEQAYLLAWRVATLRQLDRKNEAVRELVTELICAGSLEMFFKSSEDSLVKFTAGTGFKAKLDGAIDAIELTKLDARNWNAAFKLDGLTYTIPISMDYPPRNLPHYIRKYYVNSEQDVTRDKLISHIKERSFYKRLK